MIQKLDILLEIFYRTCDNDWILQIAKIPFFKISIVNKKVEYIKSIYIF